MRILPPAIAAARQPGATTFCHCWRLTRRDGWRIGVTDHDSDLVIDGMTFEAGDGFEASAGEHASGFSTGGGEITGLISSDRITEADIAAGLYDGAEIMRYLVDWQAPALDFPLQRATIGEIRRGDGHFVAETRDAFHALDQTRGRRFTVTCQAELGDAACRMAMTGAPFRRVGTILAVEGRQLFSAAIATEAPAGFFTGGLVTFTSGANAGLAMKIREHGAEGTILLWQPMTRDLAPDDGIELLAGCDKRFATCREKFANAVNFRGFPFIPSPDFVLGYARPGEGRHRGRPLVP